MMDRSYKDPETARPILRHSQLCSPALPHARHLSSQLWDDFAVVGGACRACRNLKPTGYLRWMVSNRPAQQGMTSILRHVFEYDTIDIVLGIWYHNIGTHCKSCSIWGYACRTVSRPVSAWSIRRLASHGHPEVSTSAHLRGRW